MNANKIAVRWKQWMLMRLATRRLSNLHACGNLLRCTSCAATCLSGTYSPHAAIRSSSDLLQANVLFRNFPYCIVDLLSIEFHPWLHLAVKENRQKSNVHRAAQRLLRDILHSSSKRSLRRNDSVSRQNKTAVYLVLCIAERPRNRRFKSRSIETLKSSL